MKRYIAQFSHVGFPELYRVVDTIEGCALSEPKPYHEANDEAQARNDGTFGQAEVLDFTGGMGAWLGGLNLPVAP